MATFNAAQIISITILFITFLAIPSIAKVADTTLDTLPMRFASVILVLGVLSYDRFIALALFIVVAALYIQHHHDDLSGVMFNNREYDMPIGSIKDPSAMKELKHGGHANESSDVMDFIPKQSVQDNSFQRIGQSKDEKDILVSEQLGSKAQSIFREDAQNAATLDKANRRGYSDEY
jgi:hypothetical protein